MTGGSVHHRSASHGCRPYSLTRSALSLPPLPVQAGTMAATSEALALARRLGVDPKVRGWEPTGWAVGVFFLFAQGFAVFRGSSQCPASQPHV